MSQIVNEHNLETFVRPARAEKKFAVLYRLEECTFNVEYDKYTWSYINHQASELGIFGSRETVTKEIKRLIHEKIKNGYSKLKNSPDSGAPINLERDLFAWLSGKFDEIQYLAEKIKIPFSQIIRKQDGFYLEFRDSKLSSKLVKIQI